MTAVLRRSLVGKHSNLVQTIGRAVKEPHIGAFLRAAARALPKSFDRERLGSIDVERDDRHAALTRVLAFEFSDDDVLVALRRALAVLPELMTKQTNSTGFHRQHFAQALLADGSDDSLDTLMPFIDCALGGDDALLDDLREALRLVRLSPATRRIASVLDAASTREGKRAGAAEVATAAALSKTPPRLEFWFSNTLRQRRAFDLDVRVDTRKTQWFEVQLTIGTRRARFAPRVDERSERRLPKLASLAKYDAWLREVLELTNTRALKGTLLTSSLRGRDRERLLSWLCGA